MTAEIHIDNIHQITDPLRRVLEDAAVVVDRIDELLPGDDLRMPEAVERQAKTAHGAMELSLHALESLASGVTNVAADQRRASTRRTTS